MMRAAYVVMFLPSEKEGYFQVDLTNIIQGVRRFTLQPWVQVKAVHLLLTVKHIQKKKKKNQMMPL